VLWRTNSPGPWNETAMQRMALKPMTHGGRPSSTATTAAIKQAQQPSAENFE